MHLSGHMHPHTAATAFQDPRYLRNEQYLKSTRAGQSLVGPELKRCRQFFAYLLETEGAIRITKDTGLFVASRPKRAVRRSSSVFVRVRPCSRKTRRVQP